MAPITYLLPLKVAVTVGFIFSLSFLPSIPGYSENLKQREMVLGSKPPGCENKCLNCRPCIATLVIPSHQKTKAFMSTSSSRGEDDRYYLLSWKCRCGNKLYQP
ncbi:EPIDERMAL PATTERNING FACTOR-like protein 8 [Alnus glutinosa]|uniref:EPIDERMAL PATTERNING FACTOR-like protein 8 n=1 Tax=Alnus glutinosa TaxID=3517 RepID=UPI002D79DC3D|nr:EPIDERMAL PATTERNING FACTOR-like protein 8 [Alnus glutinosa]